MPKFIIVLTLIILCGFNAPVRADSDLPQSPVVRPIASLVGEKLSYNISFLWFKKIAQGEIRLDKGPKIGTYLATLTAKTRGMAAFFTRNRVETYTTLMEEGPDGRLRPLLQTSDTKKDKRGKATHRLTSYRFDFATQQVMYQKSVNGVEQQKTLLPMNPEQPTYDFLSAFYNLRLGRLGPFEVGKDIQLAAFSRKGPEKIVISRLTKKDQKKMGVSADLLLCKVLMAPETFKAKSRDVYVGFDEKLRPQLAVVKNVIGLGDVRGILTQVVEPTKLPSR
ncbi:MAG: DUF3108 domain-containing protein [Geopsychrobacter sp.]|nr:DUF3108 domain-containing protein [Geopsychrobacter sp.]